MAAKKAVKESDDDKHIRRTYVLVLSSLSVLLPIPALISVLTSGILLKKRLVDFSTSQFIFSCLFSLGLAIFLDLALVWGFGGLLFLIYVVGAIILYAWRRAIRG